MPKDRSISCSGSRLGQRVGRGPISIMKTLQDSVSLRAHLPGSQM